IVAVEGQRPRRGFRGEPVKPPPRTAEFGGPAGHLDCDSVGAGRAAEAHLQAGQPPRLSRRYAQSLCDEILPTVVIHAGCSPPMRLVRNAPSLLTRQVPEAFHSRSNAAHRLPKRSKRDQNRPVSGLSNGRVGRARFELAVSWSQTRRFTELSYRPRKL